MTTIKSGWLRQVMKSKLADCHKDRPLYAKGMCRSCYEKQLRSRNPGYADRQRKNCASWCKHHAAQKRATDREYRLKQDPAILRARALWSKYRMTPQQYKAILDRQGGKCAICGRPPRRSRLSVDHCHSSGKIRGLLCFRCNFGLSWFAEDAARLRRASDYLAGVTHPHLEVTEL